MSLFTSYGIRFHNASMAEAVLLSAISAQEVVTGTEVMNDVDAGSPYPQHVAINAQKPSATATTKDIAGGFDLLGSEGWPISAQPAPTARPGLDFFQLAIDSTTGRPFTTSVHRRINIQRGIVVPTQLQVQHQQDAQLSMSAFAIADPSDTGGIGVLPVTSFAAEAAPTGLGGGSRHTLGTVDVGGIELGCNLSVQIDFAVTVTSEGCNSDIHDAALYIASIQPVITIQGKNLAKFAGSGAIPLIGKGAAHADTSIVLRKRLQTAAGFVADATAEHIEITAAGLAHWQTVHTAQGNQRVEDTLVITCRHDGTNVPVVIDTAFAISA